MSVGLSLLTLGSETPTVMRQASLWKPARRVGDVARGGRRRANQRRNGTEQLKHSPHRPSHSDAVRPASNELRMAGRQLRVNLMRRRVLLRFTNGLLVRASRARIVFSLPFFGRTPVIIAERQRAVADKLAGRPAGLVMDQKPTFSSPAGRQRMTPHRPEQPSAMSSSALPGRWIASGLDRPPLARIGVIMRKRRQGARVEARLTKMRTQ
jgi:hypothetical protein